MDETKHYEGHVERDEIISRKYVTVTLSSERSLIRWRDKRRFI